MVGTQALILDMLATEVEPTEASSLVRRARTGDEAAFGRLIAEHETFVLRTAWRLLRDIEEARDIAQEAFLRFHRHLASFNPDRDPAPWLYRVTVNLSLTALRRRRRRSQVPLPNDDRGELLSADPPEQERRDDAADARRLLAALFDRLTEMERAAIVLRDLEGLDIAQVAKALRCRRGTVRSHLSRGRLKLRTALQAQGAVP